MVLRSTLFYVGFTLWTLAYAPLTPLAWLLLSRTQRIAFCGLWARGGARWLSWSCGIGVDVQGEAPARDRPVVLVCNHQSALETLLLWRYFPRMAVVLKAELLRLPVIGWALPLAWPIAIQREAGRKALEQVLSEGRKRLEAGLPVLIFPEGTRQACGEVGRFHQSAVQLARTCGVPIQTIALNSGCFWPKGQWRKYPGTVRLEFGPVVPVSDSNARFTALLEARIRSTVEAMPRGPGFRVADASRPPRRRRYPPQ